MAQLRLTLQVGWRLRIRWTLQPINRFKQKEEIDIVKQVNIYGYVCPFVVTSVLLWSHLYVKHCRDFTDYCVTSVFMTVTSVVRPSDTDSLCDDDDGTMKLISVRVSAYIRTNLSPLNMPPPLSPSTAGNSGRQKTTNLQGEQRDLR